MSKSEYKYDECDSCKNRYTADVCEKCQVQEGSPKFYEKWACRECGNPFDDWFNSCSMENDQLCEECYESLHDEE